MVRGGARAGAIGGKLLGAGGGGFLLLLAPPCRRRAIREALGRPREVAFHIARHGSRIIFRQPSRARAGVGDGGMLVGETASDGPVTVGIRRPAVLSD